MNNWIIRPTIYFTSGNEYAFIICFILSLLLATPWATAQNKNTHDVTQIRIDTLNNTLESQLEIADSDFIKQDYTAARPWYEKAAQQNHMAAQHNLGTLYYQARGVTQDFFIAKMWYEKAAAQDFALSQYLLGKIYQDGQGVSRDTQKSHQLFQQACNNQLQQACDVLKN